METIPQRKKPKNVRRNMQLELRKVLVPLPTTLPR
jgi:hypothetical protein